MSVDALSILVSVLIGARRWADPHSAPSAYRVKDCDKPARRFHILRNLDPRVGNV